LNAHVSQLALFTLTLRVRVVFGITIMEEIVRYWNGIVEVLQVWVI